jgi:hypothetical protein
MRETVAVSGRTAPDDEGARSGATAVAGRRPTTDKTEKEVPRE